MSIVALGAVLIAVGVAVVVVEAHASTGGVLGLAGVLAAVAGIGLALAGAGIALVVAVPVVVVLALAGVLATLMMAHKVVVAGRQAVRTGPSALIGRAALVRTWQGDTGQVVADGALWGARRAFGWSGPDPVPGQTVMVSELDGLTLAVRKPFVWEEMLLVWKPSSLSW